MARQTNTRELVREYAKAALERGEKPTQAMIKRQIYEEHGTTASPNVVLDELNQFLTEAGKLSVRRFALPNMPAKVAEAATVFWELSCQKADEHVEARIRQVEERERQAEQSIQAAEHLLAEEKVNNTTLTHDLALATQALEQRSQALDELKQQLAALRAEMHEKDIKLDLLTARAADLTADRIRTEAACAQRITEIETNTKLELDRVRAEHEKAVDHLHAAHQAEAQTWDGLRKHLLNQTDQIRQAAKSADERQRNLIADLEIRTGALTRKANDASEEASKLSGKLEALNIQLEKMEMAERGSISKREELQQQHSRITAWLALESPTVYKAYLAEFSQTNESNKTEAAAK